MSSSSEEMREIIQQLKDRRKSLGYSQIDVDRLHGCASGLTAKWECDVRTPSLPSLVNWARALDAHLVIGGTPVRTALRDTEQIILDIMNTGCELNIVGTVQLVDKNLILEEGAKTRALIKKMLEVE